MERSRMRNSVSASISHLSCSFSVSSLNPHKRIRQQEGQYMNPTSLITDNITEILIKIIEFTHARQKIIIRNITNMNNPGFVPQKVAVKEFSKLLNAAIDEHIQNQRLLLRDTEHFKFGTNGNFEVKPTDDRDNKLLLERNRDEYLELQIKKLLENSLNQRVAAELLRQKQNSLSADY
jgi:flagellar basal-body rod protein FlgB